MLKFTKLLVIFSALLVLFSTPRFVLAQGANSSSTNFNTSDSKASVYTRVGVDPNKKLDLSLATAIQMALESNFDIKIARENVENAEFSLKASNGPYDFDINTYFNYSKGGDPISSILNKTKGFGVSVNLTREIYNYNGVISKRFAAGGLFQIDFDNTRLATDEIFTRLQKEYRSSLRVSYRQPLLRNFRINEEEKTRKARKKQLDISDLEFRQKLVNLVAQVQAAYYDLVFAIKNEEIYQEAVELAQTQLEKNKVQVEAGEIAPIELVSAKSQLEMRKSQAVSANLAITQAENQLKKLILGNPADNLWYYCVLPTNKLEFVGSQIKLESALKTALSERTELKKLDTEFEINQVTLNFFINQMKPGLDVVGSFVGQGLVGERNNVGQQVSPIVIGNYFEGLLNLFKFSGFGMGVVVSYPMGNQTAIANRNNAVIVSKQIDEQKMMMIQKIMVEVRDTVQAVESASQRVTATNAALEAAREELAAEQARYDSGLSTNFLVFSRQNSLSFAYGEYSRALADYQKAQIELRRVMGDNTKGLLKD